MFCSLALTAYYDKHIYLLLLLVWTLVTSTKDQRGACRGTGAIIYPASLSLRAALFLTLSTYAVLTPHLMGERRG